MLKNSISILLIAKILRKHATAVLLFMVGSNLLMLAVPVFMAQVYDRVLSSRSYETLTYLSLITVIALVTYGVLEGVRGILAHRLVTQFMATTAYDVIDRLMQSSLPEAKRNQIARDLNQTASFMAGRSAMGLLDLPFVPVFVFLLIFVHWQLAVLSLISIVALMATTALNTRLSKEQEKKASEQSNEALQLAAASFNRDEDVRAMGMQPAMLERWSTVTGKALLAADAANSTSSRLYGFSKLVRQLVQISQLALGAILVLRGEMSGGLIFVASTLAGRALQPIEQLLGASAGILHTQAAWNRIEEFMAGNSKLADPIALPAAQGKLDVDGVSFSTSTEPGAPQIVSNVRLALAPGQLSALIGPSGAGKSTLARIIAGALSPTDGKVRLDGFDYDQWKVDARGAAIGYVGQDVNLFTGSVAENISRMSTSINEAMILDAARKAGVHDLIASLPEGYNTKIGPGGVRLSGGQRQRIALARAFYGAPRLLVLDEPNSNLDTAGEKLLADALLAAKKTGTTILLVSQREAILSIADRVLVMEDGRIVRDLVPAPLKPATTVPPRPAAIQERAVPAPIVSPAATTLQ